MNKFFALILLYFLILPAVFAETLVKASADYKWKFPTDHGSHPDFETEWWYITGHLTDAGSDIFESQTKYGFQITFFRRVSLDAENKKAQTFLAHAALSDINNNNFIHSQRLADNLLAGASETGLNVWNNDWELKEYAPNCFKARVHLSYKPLVKIEFDFKLEHDLILHGQNGYSKKASCADCASMYYSIPRIDTSAILYQDENETKLDGLSWFDHEFFTNILGAEQIGWDWFNLMFKDGTNLMAFAVRSETDKRNFVSGTLQNGKHTKHLSKGDINWLTEKTSRMKSGTEYPTGWKLMLDSNFSSLEMHSLLEQQEIASSQASVPSYWEGAIRAKDALGYFEMTGYDKLAKPPLK